MFSNCHQNNCHHKHTIAHEDRASFYRYDIHCLWIINSFSKHAAVSFFCSHDNLFLFHMEYYLRYSIMTVTFLSFPSMRQLIPFILSYDNRLLEQSIFTVRLDKLNTKQHLYAYKHIFFSLKYNLFKHSIIGFHF